MSGAIHYPHRSLLRRVRHGRTTSRLHPVAARRRRARPRSHREPTRPAVVRLCFPATPRARLLLRPTPQPFPPALPGWSARGPSRSAAAPQPLRRFGTTGTFLQGSGSGCSSPPAGTLPRQALASFRWTHRPLPAAAPRRHSLAGARLYPRYLGSVCVTHGSTPLPQEVWSGRLRTGRDLTPACQRCSRRAGYPCGVTRSDSCDGHPRPYSSPGQRATTGQPAPAARRFFLPRPATPAPSSCCPPPSTGSK